MHCKRIDMIQFRPSFTHPQQSFGIFDVLRQTFFVIAEISSAEVDDFRPIRVVLAAHNVPELKVIVKDAGLAQCLYSTHGRLIQLFR
jgi:hypothetical protein